jgi:ABC-type transport system involved in cytochrome bd biosynthesis fused ATPase/permease subunit
MSPTEPAGPRARVVWEFSFAVLMQAVQVAALLIALVYWFVVNANRGEDNQRRLAEMQANVSAQIADLRQAVAGGLGDVRLQIGTLPDQRARLDQAERRFTEIDTRNAGFDTRITAVEHQVIELRSDMTAITRASNVPLPGARR